eukprot:Rhum_TRINITY_DN14382_c15_g1::Rhum_TRINITY_DN14382_c15_g1_i1::g.85366::m.85366
MRVRRRCLRCLFSFRLVLSPFCVNGKDWGKGGGGRKSGGLPLERIVRLRKQRLLRCPVHLEPQRVPFLQQQPEVLAQHRVGVPEPVPRHLEHLGQVCLELHHGVRAQPREQVVHHRRRRSPAQRRLVQSQHVEGEVGHAVHRRQHLVRCVDAQHRQRLHRRRAHDLVLPVVAPFEQRVADRAPHAAQPTPPHGVAQHVRELHDPVRLLHGVPQTEVAGLRTSSDAAAAAATRLPPRRRRRRRQFPGRVRSGPHPRLPHAVLRLLRRTRGGRRPVPLEQQRQCVGRVPVAQRAEPLPGLHEHERLVVAQVRHERLEDRLQVLRDEPPPGRLPRRQRRGARLLFFALPLRHLRVRRARQVLRRVRHVVRDQPREHDQRVADRRRLRRRQVRQRRVVQLFDAHRVGGNAAVVFFLCGGRRRRRLFRPLPLGRSSSATVQLLVQPRQPDLARRQHLRDLWLRAHRAVHGRPQRREPRLVEAQHDLVRQRQLQQRQPKRQALQGLLFLLCLRLLLLLLLQGVDHQRRGRRRTLFLLFLLRPTVVPAALVHEERDEHGGLRAALQARRAELLAEAQRQPHGDELQRRRRRRSRVRRRVVHEQVGEDVGGDGGVALLRHVEQHLEERLHAAVHDDYRRVPLSQPLPACRLLLLLSRPVQLEVALPRRRRRSL